MNASESSEAFFGLSIGRGVMMSRSRCAKDSASCDTKFCLLHEHRVLADVLLKNFVAATVFSVIYFLNVVEEFRSCLSKPEESVPFWAFYRAGSYDGSLLHIWVSLLKLLLFCSCCCLNTSSFSFNVSTNFLLCFLYDFS